MPRPCASCAHPKRDELDRKLRSGTTHADVSRWLRSIGAPVGVHAIGRHARDHLGVPATIGARPVSTDFLTAVVDSARETLASDGATVKDGIAAQRALDARRARDADRDLMARVAIALSGGARRIVSPEVDAIEAEFRDLDTRLLDAGAA